MIEFTGSGIEMANSLHQSDVAFDSLAESVLDLATDTSWPEGDQGSAASLLAIEIAEHCWAIAACAADGRISPTLTLLRPLQERVYLIGAVATDRTFAKRYLSNEGALSEGPGGGRGLSDEARGVLARASAPDRQARAALHAPWIRLQPLLSDYTHGSTSRGAGATIGVAAEPTSDGSVGSLILIGNALFVATYGVATAASSLSGPLKVDMSAAICPWTRTLRLLASSGSSELRWAGELLKETDRLAAHFTPIAPREDEGGQ